MRTVTAGEVSGSNQTMQYVRTMRQHGKCISKKEGCSNTRFSTDLKAMCTRTEICYGMATLG